MKARIASTLAFLVAISLWKVVRPDVVSALYHVLQSLATDPLLIHGGLIRGHGSEVHTPGLTVLLPALLISLWGKQPFAWIALWALVFGLSLAGFLFFALALKDVPLSAGALTFLQYYLIRPLSMGIPLWLIFGDRIRVQAGEQKPEA